MVVGKNAAVDARRGEAAGVFGTHAIIDSFRLKRLAAGDAGFEIEDARMRLSSAPLVESLAPNVGKIHGPRYGAVCAFGKTQVVERRLHIALVKNGGAGVRQHLIYAAPRHDVAAEKNLHRRHSIR